MNDRNVVSEFTNDQLRTAVKKSILAHVDEICEDVLSSISKSVATKLPIVDEICEDVLSSTSKSVATKLPIIVDGGTYRILNWSSQKAIDVVDSSKSSRANVVICEKSENKTSQQWIAIQSWSNREYFFFKNVNSGMFLDVKGGRIHSILWQYETNASGAQLFKIVANSDGSVFLHSVRQPTYKVSVKSDVHNDGVQIYLSNDTQDRTKWKLEAVN